MFNMKLRASFLALLLPLLLNASHILSDIILKPEAIKIIDSIGNELNEKTGIHAYVFITNDILPVGFNMVDDVKKLEEKMSKPSVLFFFAPNALITENMEETGRVGIIPSSDDVRKLYDYDDVRDAALDVISIKDKNLKEDKHNIGILQAYSELADNIANSKNVEMTTTIPNDTEYIVLVLRIIIYSGFALVLWIYLVRPRFARKKND